MSSEESHNPQDPDAFIEEFEEAIRRLALEKLADNAQVEAFGFEDRPFTITRAERGSAIVISRADPHDTAWLSIQLPVDPKDQEVEPFITHIPIEGLHGNKLTHADAESYATLVGMLGWDIGL